MSLETRLRLTEIFYSLQGESRSIGWPTVFIRLTGCPLRCIYCDTKYAYQGGQWRSILSVMQQVQSYNATYVTVTGGEPLAQKNCLPLLVALCDEGYEVSLETSGALDISQVDSRVVRVVDVKTPGSGEAEKNLLTNFSYLSDKDQIKFVVCDREDYLWSKSFLEEHQLASCCEVLFSASQGQLTDTTLADWLLEDRLPVRFQIQLHKYLWNDAQGK